MHEAFLHDIIEHKKKKQIEFHKRMNKGKFTMLCSPVEQNLFTIKSYKNWLQFCFTETQDELINAIINIIKESPMQWRVNFKPLTNFGGAKLQNALIVLLWNIVVPQINARDKYYYTIDIIIFLIVFDESDSIILLCNSCVSFLITFSISNNNNDLKIEHFNIC